MAYDEELVSRLRAAFARALAPTDEIEEKKMFGGLSEMVNGHMCIGVLGADLVIHLPPDEADACLKLPHVRPMDFTGKPMRGWLYVGPAASRTDGDLDAWVRRALDFVHAAGPKKSGSSGAKKGAASTKKAEDRAPRKTDKPSRRGRP